MVVKITSFYLPLNPCLPARPQWRLSDIVGRNSYAKPSGGLGVYSINIEEFQAGWHFHPG